MSIPSNSSSPLDNLSVAAPCHANWNEMSGDDRARFCQLCRKHVYDLSAMSRTDAEALIREKEGRPCVRFAKRADGTIISDNCPVGLRAIRNRLRWIGGAVAAAFATIAGIALASESTTGTPMPVAPRPPEPRCEMGDVASPGPANVKPAAPPKVEPRVKMGEATMMGSVAQPAQVAPPKVEQPAEYKMGKIAAPMPPENAPPPDLKKN